MPDAPITPKPNVKSTPPIKPSTGIKPQVGAKPGAPGGKTEEEKWLSAKVGEIKNEVETQVKVIYQSLEELEEVHSILMQQVIQRIEKKFGTGNVTQETYDLMDTEYYDMVYDNVDKLVSHIDTGTEKVIVKIGDALKIGLKEILNSFKKT